LYESIPDKSKVLVNKKVKTVDHSEDGVVVHCEDGSEYAGSMIAGADGVHSTIRGEMWRHMEQSKKGKSKAKKDRKGMRCDTFLLFFFFLNHVKTQPNAMNSYHS
jgi:flavin-dependent dehydrogenase